MAMRNNFSSITILIVLVLSSLMASCGYRFVSSGGIVPEGAKTIAIPVFLNGTNEPYVDTDMTRAVVEEFLTDGRLSVVNLEDADLVLRGKILKFELVPTSYAAPTGNLADTRVSTYNVSITLSLSVEDARNQKVLLQEKGLGMTFISSFPVMLGDVSSTKTAKEAAIRSACRDVALTVRSRVLDAF